MVVLMGSHASFVKMLKTREIHTPTLSSRNKNGHETYLDPIYLWTISWGSKAALKKLSFTQFWIDFNRFKGRLWPNYEDYKNIKI